MIGGHNRRSCTKWISKLYQDESIRPSEIIRFLSSVCKEKGTNMSKFQNYLKRFDIAANVTDEELEKTQALLHLYGPTLRRAVRGIDEFEEECYESRRQSVTDFINLAVDYDRDTDRKRIAERLTEMGHSMQLLSILEDALLLVKDGPDPGARYYDILRARYFDAYCRSNEDAYLALGISSATFYRNIKPAVRMLAANLWCVVIPDLILAEQRRNAEAAHFGLSDTVESDIQMRDRVRVC